MKHQGKLATVKDLLPMYWIRAVQFTPTRGVPGQNRENDYVSMAKIRVRW